MIVLRIIAFTILFPGTIAGLFPRLLIPREVWDRGPQWDVSALAGVALAAVGMGIYCWCAWAFATRGRGTPAPYDPPRKLVVNGLYRYTRNPIYIGVLGVVLGQAILWKLMPLVVYCAIVAVAFHLRVVFYEEPTLRASFGEGLERYRREVPRWLPRIPKRPSVSN